MSLRDSGGNWHKLEAYISDHSDAMFSHGVCPFRVKNHCADLVPQ